MPLGNKRGISIIALLVVLVMLVCSSACIQPTNVNSGSGPSYEPGAAPAPAGQGSVTPDPAPATPGTTQIAGTSGESGNQTTKNTSNGAKYSAGSSVQKHPADSSYDKDRGWVIVKVNDDGTYTVGQIYLDPKVSVWFRVREELLVNRAVHAVERDYPVLGGAVDWNNFPTKHGVVDQYGTTRLEW